VGLPWLFKGTLRAVPDTFVVQETEIILFSNVLVFYISLDLMRETSPLISSGSNDLTSFVFEVRSRVESGRTRSGCFHFHIWLRKRNQIRKGHKRKRTCGISKDSETN
jgi:hypothetical protein